MKRFVCRVCGFRGMHDEMWRHSFLVHHHERPALAVEEEVGTFVTLQDRQD